ncbi:CDP-alcohol phosphatidyltransferase family protein [Pacificibacter marinus]|uniref:CDP-alcohol phosphatidyltransferase family protein n=1 Tax=Pacificibacter marinus TaxID=658057 RepID=UPI001C0731C3|nr:CDP-alcohol phosphatidyltransferase family protein [Pacificibacter marinus]MBU2867284.1 CDP-alcohol phosphatidyltransferase family protein [Pacificibacter marinus]
MFDARIQPLQKRLLDRPATWFVTRGIGADQITIAGFAIGLLAVPAIAFGIYWAGLIFLIVNRLADGLDGAVARISGPTDRGAFLDIALDFVFYAVFPLGFAIATPANALPAAVLIAAFVGTGSSFLAYAAIAAKRGDTAEAFPTKGIYYLGGLTEGFETIALFVLMLLWPALFPLLAYLFSAACVLTTLLRWSHGWTAFAPMALKKQKPQDSNDTRPQSQSTTIQDVS